MVMSFFLPSAATAKQYAAKTKPIVPKIETPTAVNHLFLAKQGLHGKNRCVTAGPRIANMYPVTRPAHVEQRPRSVQPITPHVVGDTKCKWIQKQKKESEKGSKINKGSSSPTKTEAETHIGKEIETNNNICMTEETCNLKASVNEEGKINDNSVVSCKTDDENGLNDSGLGTSLHSNSTLDATDQDIKQVDNISQDGKNNNAIHDNTQLKKSENTLDNVVLQSDRQSERTMNDNVEYDTKSETMTGLQVMHIQETDLNANRLSVGTCREIQESTHEAGIEGQTEHVMVSDKYDSHTDVIKLKLSSENGATSDGKEHESADEADSGALDEQSVRDLSQSMDNNDAQKNVDASDNEEVNSKTEEVSRDKCDSQLPTETECDNSSSISVLDVNSHEPEAVADGNVNNNCVSEDRHDPQAEVSQQTSGNVDSGKDSKVKSLKPVKSILKNSKERVGSPQTKSVDMYYCSKKSLAAKSTSFDDHLHTYRHQKKSFNPFPVKHVNTNRAKTGIKLGLYKQSTLDEFERNLRKPVWGK